MNRIGMVQWRLRPPAHKRRLPSGFIEPCQPVLFDKVPTGREWVHELKWDGYRIIARRDGDQVRLWSRNSRNWALAFPSIAEAMRYLPGDSVVIDGEAVCFGEDGRPVFYALRSRSRCEKARLAAFDLLGFDGQDLRGLPLYERRMLLTGLLRGAPDELGLSEQFPGDEGASLFRHACALGLEGIISKRRDAPYRCGRSDTWRKIVCPEYRR